MSATISTRTNRYGDGLESDLICVEGLRGTHFDLCRIGIVPEGREGRQKFGGPMVPGPWGFAVTQALIIDNYGGTGRERKQAMKVKAGEPLTIEGLPGMWALRSPDRQKFEGDGPVLVEYEEGLN